MLAKKSHIQWNCNEKQKIVTQVMWLNLNSPFYQPQWHSFTHKKTAIFLPNAHNLNILNALAALVLEYFSYSHFVGRDTAEIDINHIVCIYLTFSGQFMVQWLVIDGYFYCESCYSFLCRFWRKWMWHLSLQKFSTQLLNVLRQNGE